MADSANIKVFKLVTAADTTGVTQVSQSLNKLKDAAEESSKSAKRSKNNFEGLDHVFRALAGDSMPELSEAIGSLRFGPVIASAAIAAEFIKAAIERVQKAAEQAATAVQAAFNAERDAAKEATESTDEFAESIEKASHPAD